VKAIIIARVSTEEQKDAGLSLPAQIARLEKYCQSKGFEIIKTCSFDESAYKNQRDEFDLIIDFILVQKEKVIICCDKVDRISRNIFDTRISKLYEKALTDEIELHFVSDGQIINSRISAVEKFQFSISLGLAKYYSDAISDNVKRAIEQKLHKGEWLAKAPYGYKNIRKPDGSTDIIIDEYAASIIKKAFELYATSAYSMELLCEKLKKEYCISWTKGYLGKILQNPFYHGLMIVKGKQYSHRYPPIISCQLFEQVQNIKSGFKKKPFKYAGLPYTYRGLIRCGDCGLAVTPEKHKEYIYYHCTQFNGKHGAKWMREEDITEQLGQFFKSLQMPEEVLLKIVETLSKVHQDKIEFHNKHLEDLTRKQTDLTKMMDNLYMDKLRGKISDEQYERFHDSFREQMSDINDRIARLQEAEDNYYITAKSVLDLTNRAYELFVSSEVEEKRQLIKLVLSNLRIEGEKLLYEPQKPFDVIAECTERQLWRG
jgi:site-specific DNA recombinase